MQRDEVLSLLDGVEERRIAVIGDIMLDIYTLGFVRRISPEAPVPVVEFHERRSSPGGAANAAVCVAALGAHTTVFGTVGEDADGSEVESMLRDRGVEVSLSRSAVEPTITKHRIWSDNQQLLRLDTEQRPQRGESLRLLQESFNAEGFDAVLLSDYGKGVLDDDSCAWVIAECARHSTPVVVDPKSRDFTRYRGSTIIKPNEREAQLAFETATGRTGTIDEVGLYLVEHIATHAAITRGQDGIQLFTDDRAINVPVHRQSVFDVTGAGDVAAAALTTCVALDRNLLNACRLANAAARISVSRVGTGPVTVEDLAAEVEPDE